jgi:hypothetical protein
LEAERNLTGMRDLLKEKGLHFLYVLEVATDGQDINWEKQPALIEEWNVGSMEYKERKIRNGTY